MAKPLNETIGILEKSMNTLISIKLMDFNGKRAIDIREYYQNKAGDLCPTRKGIFIPVEHLTQLVTYVEQAEAMHHDLSQQKN